jgi:hypothetical protein
MSHKLIVAPLAVVALSLTGCFLGIGTKGPQNGAVVTGKPLAVVDDVKVWTTEYQEKVGTTVHHDAGGNAIGTSDTYATRTQVHSKNVWYPVQGSEQISDEDFFRIAGDDEARDETRRLKSRAKRRLRIGQAALGVGIVASVAAYFVPGTTPKLALSLGGLGGSIGGYFVIRGAVEQLEPDHHAVPRSRAEVAAERYNRQLGVGVGGTF